MRLFCNVVHWSCVVGAASAAVFVESLVLRIVLVAVCVGIANLIGYTEATYREIARLRTEEKP